MRRCANWRLLYPYDHFEDERAGVTLSTDFNEVNTTLERETAERLDITGIEVVEARITHLAYAPEIASAMLRRQQASAVVAAQAQDRRGCGRHGGERPESVVYQKDH